MYQFLYELIDKIPSLPSLPNMDIITNFILDLIRVSAYFLPIQQFLVMMGMWILIINWNFIYKVITKIWESIPVIS